MKVCRTKKEMQSVVQNAQANNQSIGFVATMGALHSGHLALVERSASDNDITVVSVYVNPTQFNNPEDLEKYPRTLDRDIKYLESAGCDVVFTPTDDDMYPEGKKSKSYPFGSLATKMEGEFRPGHFDGVGTVVNKLFEIIEPNNAYFGEKDYQQVLVVRKMAELEGLDVNVVGCPIEREANGLAKSSRNERLTDEQMEKGSIIYKSLLMARDLKEKGKTVEEIEKAVKETFDQQEMFDLEYFNIADTKTMELLSGSIDVPARAFIAAFAGNVRLIDNIDLN
ncbi:pantoate--beta-alanine ligase [Salibacter halophilus]|nr:pantoate--beta-alanine ligase [Salibacter halophilus]